MPNDDVVNAGRTCRTALLSPRHCEVRSNLPVSRADLQSGFVVGARWLMEGGSACVEIINVFDFFFKVLMSSLRSVVFVPRKDGVVWPLLVLPPTKRNNKTD